ncbi:hypothetical protein RsoM2USA_154 [Ralstonia phage RsoM2USA]|nr:hypothetical protein RsoM2USA_154 [Ralstonia phage RsoM2USA]
MLIISSMKSPMAPVIHINRSTRPHPNPTAPPINRALYQKCPITIPMIVVIVSHTRDATISYLQ